MTTLSDLERRYDDCIPQRELDAVRWPTLKAQIRRARMRITFAECGEDRARLLHPYTPEIASYHRREAANWRRHLDELLVEQKRRAAE